MQVPRAAARRSIGRIGRYAAIAATQRMDITGLTGVSQAQREALIALGAVQRHGPNVEPAQ